MDLARDLDPKSFLSSMRTRLAAAGAARDAFLNLDSASSASAQLASCDAIRRPLNACHGPAHLLSQVHPEAPVREAAMQAVQEMASFDTELSLDRRVFERLSAIEPEALESEEERRLLAHALRDYRRSGVDRDEATRARIQALSEEMVQVGQTFDMNIARDTRTLQFEGGEEALVGLPQDYVAAHAPDAEGRVTITTDPTDYVPFMTYAERGDLRRELYLAHSNRAAPDNLEVLRKLLTLRHEMATLLGYPNWAAYVTEDKMIKSAGAARDFVDRVAGLARERMLAEVAELLEEKRASDPQATIVHDWERGYLTERVKTKRLGFDSQTVRPFFPYTRVRDGVLATSAALFGIEFRRNTEIPVWHEAVECHDVVDGGVVVARLFLDMHPRADKYKHAAMFDVCAGIEGETIPAATLVCNFPEPKDGDPALLLHNDVTTFFHEFGHLLHHLFAGKARFLSFSGIATEWDFVEAPSQMYEEWAWDAGVLAKFATHHESGEPIAAELVQRMRAADEYGKGLHVSVQMYFAALSLSLHDRDPAGLDPMQLLVELKEERLPFPHEPGSHFLASFGHLHGYSAIYYTYMWSLVIAKDLFSRFEGDLMNGNVASEYRQSVLAPGGAKDAADLVRSFLGREYGYEAWERWLER